MCVCVPKHVCIVCGSANVCVCDGEVCVCLSASGSARRVVFNMYVLCVGLRVCQRRRERETVSVGALLEMMSL